MTMNRYLTLALCGCLGMLASAAGGAEGGVQPPAMPHVPPETQSLEDAKQLPRVTQPAALRDTLLDLQKGGLHERIEKLKRKVLDDLVPVRGGTYMMGDFGSVFLKSGLPFTIYSDNKPLHKVTLSSFKISRYKTTFAEFDVFLDATHQPHVDSDVLPYRNALVPAGATWKQAKDYCQWLGKQTGEPLDLPTEAQWEYAARSRGQNFLFATDDGNLAFGRNIDDYYQRKLIIPLADNPDKQGKRIPTRNYPIGMFPGNPLGLYDMNSDGYEWVNDWYADDYYQHSPENNPRGPVSGQWKVIRSTSSDERKGPYNNNLSRGYADPDLLLDVATGKVHTDFWTNKPEPIYPGVYSFRCASNSRESAQVRE
ncbi:sulfatase-modifying factor enzyme 1 family protein [Burkholderia pseudomallei]|uniref:formylglycine-generating enzyme family protein n=1 Tax=Burkholderia pseudomallei TaxID=28450 RepID=UPI000510030E|nr:SUMF1/EgtB/PvdO family nonheme iron enzyme [Burkholderia pseudomallei]KGC70158.1 sulfatase-modifying factor enzyme 1 family protein [Burkholderia pseudomallei]